MNYHIGRLVLSPLCVWALVRLMDILMSETCWAHKKWNKIASDINLVCHSSNITMMHGPLNIRLALPCLGAWTCNNQNSWWRDYAAALCTSHARFDPRQRRPWLRFIVVFRRAGKIAESDRFVMSVCKSAWSNSAPTGRIFVKCDIWIFFENLSGKIQIWLKSLKSIGWFT